MTLLATMAVGLSACSYFRPYEQSFHSLGTEEGRAKYRMIGGYYGLAGSSYAEKHASLDSLLAGELKARGLCNKGFDIIYRGEYQGGGYLATDALCR